MPGAGKRIDTFKIGQVGERGRRQRHRRDKASALARHGVQDGRRDPALDPEPHRVREPRAARQQRGARADLQPAAAAARGDPPDERHRRHGARAVRGHHIPAVRPLRPARRQLRERARPRLAVVRVPDAVPTPGARHGLRHGQRDEAARQRAAGSVLAPLALRRGTAAQAGVALPVRGGGRNTRQTLTLRAKAGNVTERAYTNNLHRVGQL